MELITPYQLKEKLPLSSSTFIAESRVTIQNILDRKDNRLLLIVGPCSIHNIDEGLEYAKKLKEVAESVKDTCYIIMRSYIEKPRTCSGWKGLVHDPHLNGSDDLESGLYTARKFLISLSEMQIPTATEFLTPHLVPYIEELISWGCVGARTSTSQIHRQFASSLPIPIGFKNSVDGNIESAINGVMAAREPHHFMHISEKGALEQIKSKGNPHAHVVLRGGLEKSNYDTQSVQKTLTALRQLELPPRLLIDCSHDNSQGKYYKQEEVFTSVLEQIQSGNEHILGMMLESNLEAGSQLIPSQLSELQKGVSITDACLDFSTTAELLTSVSSMVMSLTQS